MSQNRNRSNDNTDNNDDDSASNWAVAGLVGLAGLALGAGAYYLSSSSEAEEKKKEEERQREEARKREQARQEAQKQAGGYSMWNFVADVAKAAIAHHQTTGYSNAVVVPEHPVITNMNGLLHDIYVRYIALNDKEFEEHYDVFMTIFYRLHEQMKVADKYYNRYSSTVQFAGSHYDRLRINKPDEFDMDIIIGLPANLKEDPNNPANSDIFLEPKAPGYIQLKAGQQFQNLPKRDGNDWLINRAAYEWMDDRNYLLRSKFAYWFKSVVDKAMNTFAMNKNGRRMMTVKGVTYTLRLSSSGPAVTLIIENTQAKFKLDVDLVPALKFPENRWPICKPYRKVPDNCHHDIFMVVPKPMKDGLSRYDTDRSWRLAMHLQERDLMHGTENMRQAIRLIKKLRDSQGLNKIASYYIKTMFYHEVVARQSEPFFWRKSPAELFTIMVKKFIQHLENGEIAYFWNKENNLIGHIARPTLTGYANKLKKLVPILDDPTKNSYKLAAKFLLTEGEFKEYNDNFLHI